MSGLLKRAGFFDFPDFELFRRRMNTFKIMSSATIADVK
jgi:hypothetical protein